MARQYARKTYPKKTYPKKAWHPPGQLRAAQLGKPCPYCRSGWVEWDQGVANSRMRCSNHASVKRPCKCVWDNKGQRYFNYMRSWHWLTLVSQARKMRGRKAEAVRVQNSGYSRPKTKSSVAARWMPVILFFAAAAAVALAALLIAHAD